MDFCQDYMDKRQITAVKKKLYSSSFMQQVLILSDI